MTSKVDMLKGLAKRPLWMILPAALDAIYRVLSAPGVEIVEEAQDTRLTVFGAVADTFKSVSTGKTRAAVIPIYGPLCNDPSEAYWDGGTCYSDIQSELTAALADSTVGEILLLVDSPGGEVMGCPETAAMIYKANKVKPVNAMVTGMAASAAYYLVSQAGSITLTPSGEVGSVGVLMVHTDITQMLANIGVKLTAISAGKYKTELWPFTPLTEEAKAAAQADIDRMYNEFLDAVARGRGSRVKPDMKATNYGEGRMLGSADALAGGLVDQVATVQEVFATRTDAAKKYARQKTDAAARARELEVLGL